MGAPVASRRESAQTYGDAKATTTGISSGLLTIGEAAEFLRVSTRTINKYVAAGELPVTRFGRSVRYVPADLVAFIDAHRDGDGRAPRVRRSPSKR